jgi:hypothetical protein
LLRLIGIGPTATRVDCYWVLEFDKKFHDLN